MGFPLVGVQAAIVGLNKFNAGMSKMQSGVDRFGKVVSKTTNPVRKLGSGLVSLGTKAAKVGAAGLVAVGVAATAVGVASVRAAISFESAWAGVTKTTDGLEDEFGNLTKTGKKLQDGFRDLSKTVPITVEDLLEIGELGGQLGIADDALVDFAETIAAVGVATNLTTEEAATGFAQIANIMGTPQSQIDNMASTVVALGNNFATTERDVFNFAQRIAGAGDTAGLTEAQVFAIGAAMSSVGIQAEAGGTAVQKVLLAMHEAAIGTGGGLETFAKTAGLSAAEFSDAWEQDAGNAFKLFVEGLGAAGDDAISILDDLELKDQRLIRSFLSLSGAGDLLERTMAEANTAFEENVALQKEAAKRYATTKSKLTILKNVFKDIAIALGMRLLPAFNAVLDVATLAGKWLGDKLADVLDNVLIPAIEDAIDTLGDLVNIVKRKTLPIIKELSLVMSSAVDNILISIGFLTKGFKTLIAIPGDFSDIFTGVVETLMHVGGLSESTALSVGTVLVSAMEQAYNWAITLGNIIQTNLASAFDAISTVLDTRLIPTFTTLTSWLSEIIPQALQAISPMADVLKQVFMTLAATVVGPLVLAFRLLRGDFDSAVIPVLQFLADLIENTIIPATGKMAMFISQHSAAIIGAIQGIGVALTVVKIASVIAGIVAAVSALVSPVGLLIAGIALLGAAWADNWLGIQDVTAAVVEWLITNVPLAINTVVEFFNTVLIPAFQAFVTFIQENVIPAIVDFVDFVVTEFQKWVDWTKESWPLIQNIIEGNIEGIVFIVGAAVLLISGFWKEHGDTIIAVATATYENIKTFISGAMEVLRGVFTTVLQLINSDWSGAWETIQGVVQTALDTMNTIAANTLATLKNTVIPAAIAEAKAAMDTAWNDLVIPGFQALVEALPEIFTAAWELTKASIQTAIEALPDAMALSWEFVKTALDELVNELPGVIETAWGAVKAMMRTSIEVLKNVMSVAWNELVKPELQGLVDEIPGIIESILEAVKAAGTAIVEALKQGIADAWGGLQDWFGGQLQGLTNQLPFSEPKDASSPLYGLSKAGAAIIDNIMSGAVSAAPGAVDTFADVGADMGKSFVAAIIGNIEEGSSVIEDLLDVAGGLGSIGGGLARLFEAQQIDPLEDRMGEIDDELATLRDREAGSMYEQMWILDRIAQLELERLGVQASLTAEQERMLRLQEQQQQLDLLRQQQDLINLITEYGLDPADILGGLELGLGADLGALLDAMTRAMQQIIAQAEGALGISSPSKVFEEIGAMTGEGFALGFTNSMDSAMRGIQAITSSMAMPSFASPSTTQNQYIDNSRSVSVAVGGTSGERPARLQQANLIKRTVMEGLEGTG